MHKSSIQAAAVALLLASASTAFSQAASSAPWMNKSLSAEERTKLLLQEMTFDEKVSMLHSIIGADFKGVPKAPGAVGSAGYTPGIPRIGIPALQKTDAGMGVTNPLNTRPGDQATALPSNLATAATWNLGLAYKGGEMVATEARIKGFNVLLAGGINLAREARGGRNFENYGEDPLINGLFAGAAIQGLQSKGVVSTIKHLAYNSQETGRFTYDVKLDYPAARESDLLAFELGIEKGQPGSVMCAYNKVDTLWSCQSPFLLTGFLRDTLHYDGWVMSDWGAVRGWEDALAGLDQQAGAQLDPAIYFDLPLKAAVQSGKVPPSRIDEMTSRILKSMFRHQLFDAPAVPSKIDVSASAAVSKSVAQEAIVLLKNQLSMLPLSPDVKRVVVIGGRANVGVLQGGGSSFVVPFGGSPATLPADGEGEMRRRSIVYLPSSPLQAIKAKAPKAVVTYVDARYPSAAASAAKQADVAVVFAEQWTTESFDAADLSLPSGQDAVIAAVIKANPNTVVVVQSGGAVLMPWLDQVPAVLEAWYPGARGGEAIADVLFGDVNPSGRLPITFPASEAQLPNPVIPGWGLPDKTPFVLDMHEGAQVGYKWFATNKHKPLFPFGFGLSYTQFAYDGLSVQGGDTVTATFTLKNTGTRAGAETAQLYATVTGADGIASPRLIGWSKVALNPGEQKSVTVQADPRLLAAFDGASKQWRIKGGTYRVQLGKSSQDIQHEATTTLRARMLPAATPGSSMTVTPRAAAAPKTGLEWP